MVIMLLQDLFTITLGWIFFGGLPFDLVSKHLFCSLPCDYTRTIRLSFILLLLTNRFMWLQLNIIGQLLGFLGSGLYAYYKLTGN